MKIKETEKRLVMGEFAYVQGTDVYDITNYMFLQGVKIPLNEISFMWRETRQTFKPLNTGEYKYLESGGKHSLQITSPTVKADVVRLQVIRTFTSTAGTLPANENDIAKVVDAYNKLFTAYEQDSEYLKSQVLIADGKDQARVFPELKENEVIVRTKDGYKGFPITDVDKSLQDTIAKFSNKFIGIDTNGVPLTPNVGLVKTLTDYLHNDAIPTVATGAKTVIDNFIDTNTKPKLVAEKNKLTQEMKDEYAKLYDSHVVTVADSTIYKNPTMITIDDYVPTFQYHITTGTEPSDGILIPTSATEVTIYTQTQVIDLKGAGVDGSDKALVEGDWYFHDNTNGRPSKDKPTGLGIFQSLFKYIGDNNILFDLGQPIQNNLSSNNALLASEKSLQDVKKEVATKEPKITKKNGFNLEKSDSIILDDTNKLATAKAVKALHDEVDRLTRANAKLIADNDALAKSNYLLKTGTAVNSAKLNNKTETSNDTASTIVARDGVGATAFSHIVINGHKIEVV